MKKVIQMGSGGKQFLMLLVTQDEDYGLVLDILHLICLRFQLNMSGLWIYMYTHTHTHTHTHIYELFVVFEVTDMRRISQEDN